jgi:hypothetical protein
MRVIRAFLERRIRASIVSVAAMAPSLMPAPTGTASCGRVATSFAIPGYTDPAPSAQRELTPESLLPPHSVIA